MEYIKIQDMELSRFILETDGYGRRIDRKTAFSILELYAGNGGNVLDTARMYTGGETAAFADVPADSHYYKEIMTGKALGILNGVGDNMYNPEAIISRQNLMTICARALEYVGKLEKAEKDKTLNFSDGGAIASYAKDAVSNMIWNGIIAGNADSTINPLGNTTRAEAAVIMHRIFNHEIYILNPTGMKM